MQTQALPRTALYSLSVGYFVMGIAGLSVVGLNAPIADALAIPPGQVALLMTIFAGTYAVAAVGLQMLIGGWNRQRLILLGLGAIALGCVGAALSTSFAALAAARVVMALGAALVGPMASASGAALAPPARRGEALGVVFTGMTVSTVLGVPISAWIGHAYGWPAAMLLIGALAAVTAALVQRLVRGTGRGQRTSAADLFGVFGDLRLTTAILVMMFQMAAQFSLYAMMPAYLVKVQGFAEAQIPLVLFGFGLGGIVGNQIATRLVGTLGPERLIAIAIAGVACSAVTLFLVPPGPVAAAAVLAPLSATGFLIMAPQQARLVAMAPDRQNLVLSLNASAIYVGMAAGSAIGGTMFSTIGGGLLPLGTAALSLMAFASFKASRRRPPAGCSAAA